jgi:hypothetical protein
VNGLYVLNLEDKFVCNINTKIARLNDLNPNFICHCHLAHINEKYIERLHKDGLLEKMTKTPFTGQSERASELLGLVHIDVCGPMSSVTRGGF